ncbi:hypothetical protein D5085_03305 [Ectothiorhodospiraceae bacterium BW-2]|nr:hypothetical protein D5085_03305 [Ectothiorhodospiraceae bacterium BW-2]
MKVANPMYDVVFRYLLDDLRIAKLLLSKIINQPIESLELKPTEHKKRIQGQFTVFRVDFAAKIRQKEGNEKLVLIEIQKAKLPTDIMRFRKYLGSHYQDKNNVYQKGEKSEPLPIICIYFLGHTLAHTDSPVVRVERRYIDSATEKELEKKELFIESLSHDSYIVQIPQLKQKRRNELEVLLSIFDQSQQLANSRHYLELDEADYPKEFRRVVRRLRQAIVEEDVSELMELEDEVLDELESLERKIFMQEQVLDEQGKALDEQERALEEQGKIINEQKSVLAVKDSALAEKENALAEKESALAKKESALAKAVAVLTASGMSEQEARQVLGLLQ